jgi:hypothetical protein
MPARSSEGDVTGRSAGARPPSGCPATRLFPCTGTPLTKRMHRSSLSSLHLSGGHAVRPPSMYRIPPVTYGADSRYRMPSTMSLTGPPLARGQPLAEVLARSPGAPSPGLARRQAVVHGADSDRRDAARGPVRHPWHKPCSQRLHLRKRQALRSSPRRSLWRSDRECEEFYRSALGVTGLYAVSAVACASRRLTSVRTRSAPSEAKISRAVRSGSRASVGRPRVSRQRPCPSSACACSHGTSNRFHRSAASVNKPAASAFSRSLGSPAHTQYTPPPVQPKPGREQEQRTESPVAR